MYLVLAFSDLQGLYGGVLLQFIAPELHAYTRLLDAAEGASGWIMACPLTQAVPHSRRLASRVENRNFQQGYSANILNIKLTSVAFVSEAIETALQIMVIHCQVVRRHTDVLRGDNPRWFCAFYRDLLARSSG